MMAHLSIQFLLALFATAGFCIIFRVPVRDIPVCVVIGALGWVTNEVSMEYYASPVLGCFLGACVVGMLSDGSSRLFHEASTIFIIPGILCLVPGSNIFRTMYALLTDDFHDAVQVGTETLLMAGAIAVGLLTIGAILRVIRDLIQKTVTLRDKF